MGAARTATVPPLTAAQRAELIRCRALNIGVEPTDEDWRAELTAGARELAADLLFWNRSPDWHPRPAQRRATQRATPFGQAGRRKRRGGR